MVKNKLERKFSESVRADLDFWFMKLHNNPLTHQNTPADYILNYVNYNGLKLVLVECKQVTCKEGKGRLAFKRLKQMHDLLAFEKTRPYHHHSYFCIAYYDQTWLNSEVYIIPAFTMQIVIEEHNFVSLNREDAKQLLAAYKVKYDKVISLESIKI